MKSALLSQICDMVVYSAGRIGAFVICLWYSGRITGFRFIVHSLVMIVIAGYLITDALDFLYFKAVSWLAGDDRLRQTLSLRIYLIERRSYGPSSFISILERPLKPPLRPALAGVSLVSIELSKQE